MLSRRVNQEERRMAIEWMKGVRATHSPDSPVYEDFGRVIKILKGGDTLFNSN